MKGVHSLTKRELAKFALQKRDAGEFFERGNPSSEEIFFGSMDRFCDIAVAFRHSPKVLDVGSGSGLLLAFLKMLGHEVFAVDFVDHAQDATYNRHAIPFFVCNVEVDPLPFASDSLDAVSCCQTLEHFTYSHLPAVLEMRRVLRPGGTLEIDVPNAVSFRNRSRMLRGKHITYDYEEHYLDAQPVIDKGREYFPSRHNREFTAKELELLLRRAAFSRVAVSFLKSRRYRTGLSRLASLGTALKDAVPGFRKSLIAFAEK